MTIVQYGAHQLQQYIVRNVNNDDTILSRLQDTKKIILFCCLCLVTTRFVYFVVIDVYVRTTFVVWFV